MKEYLDLVNYVLKYGELKKNRTGMDSLSSFGYFYKIDLSEGFPLLTTKKVNFDSIVHELLWYLSGEHHIRNLRQKTKIWDSWADSDGNLETAYGRYWRRFPITNMNSHLPGEKFDFMNSNIKKDQETGAFVFDQIRYVITSLFSLKKNPEHISGRRLVVSAWMPENACQSYLPPCHYTFAFNVQGNKLNCHLTQRSADIALGVPFNIACYSLLTHILAQITGFEVGEFAHTIIDAHIYVNHIEGLKEQVKREPKVRPTIWIRSGLGIDEIKRDDIKLLNYYSHDSIKFDVSV